MWKDYFSFNKRQRNGILVLLFLIGAMLTWLFVSDHLSPSHGNIDFSKFKADLKNDNSDVRGSRSPVNIELNSANFKLLESNEKLAPYAHEIMDYREKLGGFVAKEQLRELHKMDTAAYNSICSYITIDTTQVHKLKLNSTTIKELGRHPYIGYYLAQAIVNYRIQHGDYKKLRDLLKNVAVDEATFFKISPYLSVN